jgi:hypothetical protein
VDIKNAILPRGASCTLAAVIVVSALTVGIAHAQNVITAPSNSSRSGVQSAITQTRDSLQRRASANQTKSQQQQSRTKTPVVPSYDR